MTTWLDDVHVAVARGGAEYPAQPPFHPSDSYPECPFGERSRSDNLAYAAVRQALRLLHLDEQNYGTRAWNPLSFLVTPGDTVVLKPNLIRECHALRPEEWQQVITHGSVIRAVLDYVFIAGGPTTHVVIADGPQTDSDFPAICTRNGLDEIVSFYRDRGFAVSLLDLRRDRWFQKGDVIYKRVPLPGDPAGYVTVDLAHASEFVDYRLNGRFYGADYDMADTASFHTNGRHAYVLCRTVADANVVINLPKLKTHKKTGVTLSLKNVVGVNGYRNCLPHHTRGTPADGGDEFPDSSLARRAQSQAITTFKHALHIGGGRGGAWARAAKRIGRVLFGDTHHVVRSGNWYGNDTTWRMVLDLNKALLYFDGTGAARRRPLNYLTLVDGIVAGAGDGPSAPDPVPAGLVVAGFNPVAVDTVCTTLMGFDYQRLPLLARGWQTRELPLAKFKAEAVVCESTASEWTGSFSKLLGAPHLGFRAHFGWVGRIERESHWTASHSSI